MTAAYDKVTGTKSVADAIVDAVTGVLGPQDSFLPMHEPEFSGREGEYVKECIDTGWVSSVGAFVDRIERDLQEYTGVERAVAVANGTAALHMCLILAGVEPGDEVLMPTLTFVATANAASYAGAIPHFVDSEERTLGVDAEKLEAHLAEVAEVQGDACVNRQTGAVIRALVVMHTFGHPSELDALAAVCERWKLILIEDAAESLGSFYKGRHTGHVGRLAALSFNGNKVVTTGGGGAVLTNDPELGARCKHLTTTAKVPHKWDFVHDAVGYNYRMPNLNAALGCAQIEQLPMFIERKRQLASRYAEAFAGIDGVRFVSEPDECTSNYWLSTILLDEDHADQLEPVLAGLNGANFMSRPAWTPMHRLPMYEKCPRAELSCAESIARRLVNLPSSAKLGA